jgi:PAS domain S-box-containing protein
MFSLDPFSLGIILVALGLGFWFLVRFLMRRVQQPRQMKWAVKAVDSTLPAVFESDLLESREDAVLLVGQGGRLVSINQRGREFFRLDEYEAPNLNRLSRRIRPADTFLTLCAAEGRARFALEGRMLDGVSYRIPSMPAPLMMVSLRSADLGAGLTTVVSEQSPEALKSFLEMTQGILASLDLEETLKAILENIEKYTPADLIEISLWDEDNSTLTPYHLGAAGSMGRNLTVADQRHRVAEDFSQKVLETREPLLVSSMEPGEGQQLDPSSYSDANLRSYLGLPLITGKRFVGLLELGSVTPGALKEEDLGLVQLMAGQFSVALYNALLYQSEQQRAAELSGLAELSQTIRAVRDPHQVYAGLIDSIVPLFEVENLGFLIYNELTHHLEGQVPFHGLPAQFVRLYHANIPPNSSAEKIMLQQDVIISKDAANDARFEILGLQPLAQAASMHDTALVPLQSGGKLLGYLQASNHLGKPRSFSSDEVHLLTIVASQSAPIIENARLVQQTRMRAQRSEALRAVASLASSDATLEEIFSLALRSLGDILKADVGAVFLLDRDRGALSMQRNSMYGRLPLVPEREGSLPIDHPQYPFTVTGGQHAFTSDRLTEAQALIPFYGQILEMWKIESVVAVPMVVRDKGVGEIWFGSLSANAFDQGDLQVLMTAAGQLGGVVEQSYLFEQTDDSLRRRVDQLTALTRISRELSASLDIQYLLKQVYDEALNASRADFGQIILFDIDAPVDEDPKVRAYSGNLPEVKISSLETSVLKAGEPLNVPDISKVGFSAPDPTIKSALMVPILYQDKRNGLILLYATTPSCFDETAVEIVLSLASQTALVLGNALQYEAQIKRATVLQKELDSVGQTLQIFRNLSPDSALVESLRVVANGIQEATPFRSVLVNTYDEEHDVLNRSLAVGIPEDLWEQLSARPQPWQEYLSLLSPAYKVGDIAYFIPGDEQADNIPEKLHVVNILPSTGAGGLESWHPDDLLIMPLYDVNDMIMGTISVDNPADGRRPDQVTVEMLELFALQACILIENHRQMQTLDSSLQTTAQTEKELKFTREQLPALLQKDLQQTLTVHTLHRQVERMRSGIEMAALTGRQTDVHTLLRTMAQELLMHFDLQAALIAEQSPAGPQILEVIGTIPKSANPEALFGQRNPLRSLMEDEKLVLAARMEDVPQWKNNALLGALNAQSFIGLPVIGDGRMFGIMVVGDKTLPAFSDEDWHIYAQLASQMSIGLQNLQLLNEARRSLQEVYMLLDFSRRLGSLENENILQSLVDGVLKVIPSATAAWVGLWDEVSQEIVPQAATGYADVASMLQIQYKSSDEAALPMKAFEGGRPMRVADVDFASDYNLPSEDLIHYQRATGGDVPISSMLIPILRGDHKLGILVIDNFEAGGVFGMDEEALTLSLTQQTALALENADLFRSAEGRAAQLEALTKVAGTLTSSLQPEELISSLLEQMQPVITYDTATLWLRSGDSLYIGAARGFEDSESREQIAVLIDDSRLFQEMIETYQAINVSDVRQDDRFPSLVEPEYFSWLGIPLIAKSELIGVIALEKREAMYYDPDHIRAATTFAGQAAVALENARLFADSTRRTVELDQRSERLALLNELSVELGSTLDMDVLLKIACRQLMNAIDGDGAAAVMLNADGEYELLVDEPEIKDSTLHMLPETPLLKRLRESSGIFSVEDAGEESELKDLYALYCEPRQIRSILIVPLLAGVNFEGWLFLYRNEPHRHNPSEIELARTIANQAAIAVQNALLFQETRRLTRNLERRVQERTQELRQEHQNTETLLRIITELSASLDMDHVLGRTLSVLNESLGAEHSMILLSQDKGKVYHRGSYTEWMNLENRYSARDSERRIAEWVIERRNSALVDDTENDPRWEYAAGESPGYQSVIAVPLVHGEQVLGALLLFHSEPAFFIIEQVGLLEATARQISISLSNAELFNLIRDQAENLGTMFRGQQIEASRSRAILEAVADGVLVTDSANQVTLFNSSASQILDLKQNEVVGNSLDQFMGLFGMAADTWRQTIQNWSEDPESFHRGDVYAEQIDLDNDLVVSVHLSPVFASKEFLGTVSIFRDITRDVMLDRMKTEFIANVSHELRTPITSIKGYVEVMLMGAAGSLEDQQTKFLGIVRENAERLNILVGDLLDVSRIESGQTEVSVTMVNLHELVEDVVADFQLNHRKPEKEINFSLESDADLPLVSGDPERVRQVTKNLLVNAYNYTEEDGDIFIKVFQKDAFLQVDVRDTGVGILPEEHNRIFERFYRGENPMVMATAGTGLGLAISKTLIERLGGEIWFESSGVPGEGSTFSYTLPVYHTEE